MRGSGQAITVTDKPLNPGRPVNGSTDVSAMGEY